MNKCSTCKHWRVTHHKGFTGHDGCVLPDYFFPRPDPTRGFETRFCQHPKLDTVGYLRASDDAQYSYDEGGAIETGPDFGCVHHEPLP